MAGSQMQEPTFLILSALAEGPKHGYALIEEVSVLSRGSVHLRAGTLYTALERLVESGSIAPAGETVVNGRTRRHYVLTDAGAATLAAEAERLERNAVIARSKLRLRLSPSTAGGLA
ncbi:MULTISPECIES: PadR family transcriptional regulator [unclassified Rathayibacter]|uniref:PadR family transcriptional regulator n=1 Tax=unclassified Rathayibacter TaxID=2609250 RepID=UPI001C614FE6|nr:MULTISPECIES: PadR family transcriptional regulator [unclassified Rathayibacter]